MPTASAIISARVSAVLEMVAAPVSASTPPSPTATPIRALSSGIPAVSSEPKVSARTTTATATPIMSAAPGCALALL